MAERRTYGRFVQMLETARAQYPHLAIVSSADGMWYVLSMPIVGVDEPLAPYSWGSGLWETVEGFVTSVCQPPAADDQEPPP